MAFERSVREFVADPGPIFQAVAQGCSAAGVTSRVGALRPLGFWREAANTLSEMLNVCRSCQDDVVKMRGNLLISDVDAFDDCLKRMSNVLNYAWDQARKRYRLSYPSDEGAIAPTSVGNALMTVETYCWNAFGLDTARTLPRLRAVVAKESLEPVTAAEDRLNLLEWIVIGAAVVALVGTAVAAYDRNWGLAVLVWCGSMAVAWLGNRSALGAAIGYAEQMRLLIEQKRGLVLSASGIPVSGAVNNAEEKALWKIATSWWDEVSGYPKSDLPYRIPGAAAANGDPSEAGGNGD
jgi:hypothetical protein